MKKAFKILFSVISSIIILIVLLPIILAMLLQVAPIQKWAVDTTTNFLSEKSGTKFSVSKIEIGFFNRAYFEDLYVEDPLTLDTMIYIRRIDASINNINFFNGKISLGNVTLDSVRVNMVEDANKLMNVKRVFRHFKAKVPRTDRPDFRMSATQLNLLNSHITLKKTGYVPQRKESINFKDLDLQHVNFQAQNIEMLNYDFRLAINHLSLEEVSGFKINHFSSPKCGVNQTGMRYTNVRLETPRSTLICSHFNLLYESWWDYTDFVNKITVDAEILPSIIALPTINYFARAGGLDIPLTMNIEGGVIGRIPDMKGNISKLSLSNNTQLKGDFNITGLPNVAKTDFLFTLEELTTDAQDIDDLVYTLTKKNLAPAVKNVLTQNKRLTASGEFFGLLKDFKAKCQINSDCGLIDADLQLQPEAASTRNAVKLIGNLHSTDFNIRQALQAKNLDRITLSSNVDATVWGDSINLVTRAYIDQVDFKEYAYGPIELDGSFNNQVFSGVVKSQQDPNLIFETDGTFDFTDPELPLYNFWLDLDKANLVALGFNKRDSISTVEATVRAFFTGTDIDNINGNVLFDSIIYTNHLEHSNTSDIEFFLKNSAKEKEISMTSAFADITLKGHNSYYNIFGYLAQMAKSYIPSFDDATEIVRGEGRGNIDVETHEEKYEDGYYTLDVDVKEAKNVTSIFVPGLSIASGTQVDFFFNPAKNNFSFSCESPYISTTNQFIENLNINSRNIADSLSIYLTSSLIDLGGGIELPSFSLIGSVKNNHVDLGMRFSDYNNVNSAILNIKTNIYRTQENLPQISLTIQPSNLRLSGRNWMMPQSRVLIDSTGYTIDKFSIRSSTQQLSVDGKIGRLESDSLNVIMRDVSITPLSVFVRNLGYELDGQISGDIRSTALLSKAHLDAEIEIKDLLLGGNAMGSPLIVCQYRPQTNRMNVDISNQKGAHPITGYYDLAENEFHADIDLPDIELKVLEPLIKGSLVNTSGKGSAQLTFSGGPKTPTLNGKITVDHYNAMVAYTKVYYSLSGEVDVVNNRFTLNPTKFNDSEGNTGDINAFFDSKYFRGVSFGVNGQFTNLLAINTSTKDNPYFFGKAYGTGTLNINGTDRNTNIVIAAQTAPNSVIKLPFTDVSTIDRTTFLSFVDKDNKQQESTQTQHEMFKLKTRTKLENELDIKLDIQVLPNTTATISYTNSLMDNIIEGRGTGRLQMQINPTKEIFSLQGPVQIEKGTYRLIFAIADKTFTLQNGGSLLWTGSPSNPTVDFTGIYKVRTSLEPLTGTTTSGSSSKTTVDCGIHLTGELFTPDISFDISAPNATPETQNILRNSLNTDEALSMQFMSLFVSGAFMPDMGTSSMGTMSGSILSTTGLEFISNQISSLISTNNLKIRPTYTPSTEENSEEVGIQASLSLMEDKIYIEAEGNYTAGELSNSQQNPFTGEGGITVMLNQAQTLSVKGFTRIIDRFDESQGLQESGVGVYFRQSFQSWEDLKRRYLEYLDTRRKRRLDRKSTKESTKESSD